MSNIADTDGLSINGTINNVVEDLTETKTLPFAELPNMQGLGTHYAHANHWIGYIPIENILGNSFKNLELNLTNFSIPQLIVGSSSILFKGYTYEVPTHVIDPDTKEIVINYIVDENFYNYKSLFTLASLIGNFNPVDDLTVDGPLTSNLFDSRIWLLDNYKQHVIDFVFHNCWIKVFGDLLLDYQSTEELKHSFTLAYSNFEIKMVTT